MRDLIPIVEVRKGTAELDFEVGVGEGVVVTISGGGGDSIRGSMGKPEEDTVGAKVWRFLINIGGASYCRGHTVGMNCDLSTAVGNMQMNFDLSTSQ